jgi:hypothetical protein
MFNNNEKSYMVEKRGGIFQNSGRRYLNSSVSVLMDHFSDTCSLFLYLPDFINRIHV